LSMKNLYRLRNEKKRCSSSLNLTSGAPALGVLSLSNSEKTLGSKFGIRQR
jgi:hypothetical protein